MDGKTRTMGVTLPDPSARKRLVILDSLRGLAAIWVVLHHFSESGHMPVLAAALAPSVKAALFDLGHLGVPIFFVLSGIVMTTTTIHVPLNGGNSWRFVIRRLVRLTPPYYVAIAVGLAILWAKTRVDAGARMPSPTDVLAHLAYAQDFFGVKNINSVFWTLGIEVQFYLAFALLMWVADRWATSAPDLDARVLVAWCSAVVALPWLFGWLKTPVWPGGFLNLWFSFMCGVLCGQALGLRHGNWGVAVSYSALLTGVGLNLGNSFALAAGMSGLTVCLAAHWAPLTLVMSHRALQRLGLASYSLYLFHGVVMGPAMRVFRRIWAPGLTSDAVAMAITVSSCVAVAFLAYRYIERPAIDWSRRIAFGNSSGRPAAVGSQ